MNIDLVKKDCPSCHVLYWIEAAHNERLLSSKESFFCPNGHSASYTGKSDAQLLQETRERCKKTDAENDRLVSVVLERGNEIEKLKKGKKKPKKTPKKKAKKKKEASP